MKSDLYMEFTWSRNHVKASGANQVYLLVEWRDVTARPRNDFANSRRIAEQVQLHLQIGAGVRLNALYGCKAEMLNELNYSFRLGSLSEGEHKYIVLDFEFAQHTTGNHPIVTALCTYMDASHRQVILPSRTISLQFSNHTALFVKTMDHRVEKYLKMLQNPSVVTHALSAFEEGSHVQGEEIICRRADEMLIQAIRLGDTEYLKEAEMLYALSDTFINTYSTV